MFGFHKSKIYRSNDGCCICKTKSSSSRFTDSSRYEETFRLCFGLAEDRVGDICNACVLLVKRWKKLPLGSKKNWNHVVDARAGPGFKMTKPRKIKNGDGKKKSKLKKLHKLKRQNSDAQSTTSSVSPSSPPVTATSQTMVQTSNPNKDDHLLPFTLFWIVHTGKGKRCAVGLSTKGALVKLLLILVFLSPVAVPKRRHWCLRRWPHTSQSHFLHSYQQT